MLASLRLEVTLFLMALQNLTQIRGIFVGPSSDDLLIRSTKYYPLVGLTVGGMGALVLLGAGLVLPKGVAVLLAMAATFVVTGFQTEAGFAFAVEGFLEGRTREDRLRRMRDCVIGPYGVGAVILALAIKATMLATLPIGVAAVLLVAGQAMGQMAVVHVIATTRFARNLGLRVFAPAITREGYVIALATAVATSAGLTHLLGIGPAFTAMLGCIAVAQAWRLFFVRALIGYTKACLGATFVLGELGLLLGAGVWIGP